jgi:putative transposase
MAKKKVSAAPLEERRTLLESGQGISVKRGCELIGLGRSTFYYRRRGESDLNLRLMELLDEKYTRHPFYGVPRMTDWLRKQGYPINPKRVERLMREMGIMAVYPRKRTSQPHPDHKIYPYLLRDLAVIRPDQVWCSDLTYIRLDHGFVFLVAIMDWFSRYVLSWELSITLDTGFCLAALDRALDLPAPEIFNTDQGSQFTSQDFTERLENAGVRISMDGQGRFHDNIFIERLWRSVKYEEVYLHSYETVRQARSGLARYFEFYNRERPHSSLGYRTPHEVYFEGISAQPVSGPIGVRV